MPGNDNRQPATRLRPFWVVLIASDFILFAPAAVFVGVGLANGMSAGDVFAAMVAQLTAERLNLAMISVLSLAPVLLLVVILAVGWRLGRFRETGGAVALGGSLGILAIIVAANLEFWPTYLPSLTYAGWPHGIELMLGPLIGAPIAMIIGMLLGHRLARR